MKNQNSGTFRASLFSLPIDRGDDFFPFKEVKCYFHVIVLVRDLTALHLKICLPYCVHQVLGRKMESTSGISNGEDLI